MLFCRLQIFFNSTFFKNSFRNAIRLSNNVDPDLARHIVGPYPGPNCLQKLSADDTSRLRVKTGLQVVLLFLPLPTFYLLFF